MQKKEEQNWNQRGWTAQEAQKKLQQRKEQDKDAALSAKKVEWVDAEDAFAGYGPTPWECYCG